MSIGSLELGLVCQQLALEITGVALQVNTNMFETCFPEALREDAGMLIALGPSLIPILGI
jgi:hypothetical protein